MKVKNYQDLLSEDTKSHNVYYTIKNNFLTAFTETHTERWITYNEFLTDLLDLGYDDYYNEFKERVMGGQNPNKVMMSIMHKNKEIKSIMGCYYNILQYYIEEDLMNFFK
jgi:hypothetical protein